MVQRWGTSNAIADDLDGSVNQFFAVFLFTAESRTQVAASTCRAFWADLDVGDEAHKYSSIQEAATSLREFLDSTPFPIPTYVVRSGNGLHVYWCVDEDVDAGAWKQTAKKIALIFQHRGLKYDTTRATDTASLLRVPGTINQKPGRPDSTAVILSEGGVHSFEGFVRHINKCIKAHKILNGKPQVSSSLEKLSQLERSMLAVNHSDIDKHNAVTMAEKCAQLGRVKATRGAVSEPLWYGTLQILRFVKDGAKFAHAWSKGDKRYDGQQVDAKIAQLAEKDIGPTTCEQFEKIGMQELCKECPYRGKVKSPIQLAVEVVEATQDVINFHGVDVVKGFVPQGFVLADNGGLAFIHPETKLPIEFYPYPLFVNGRVLHADNQFYVQIDSYLPLEGFVSMQVPMSICKDQGMLTEELSAHGVVCQDSEDKILRHYIIESIRQLTRKETAVKGYSRYGWDGDAFYLQDKVFTDAGPYPAVFVGSQDLCTVSGHLAEWGTVFTHYENASLAYKMAFYAGLAAPLMELLGLGGVTYSLVSRESGVGKTTVQSVVCAMYGDPELLRAQRTDTYNSLMKRLGKLNSLPLCVDEMTNIEGSDLSEFIYQVSQGREKGRLTEKSMEQTMGRWKTIVICSSNELLSAKLAANRTDSEAEQARLVEMYAPTYAPKKLLDEMNSIVRDNHGLVGPLWVDYISRNRKKISAALEHTKKHVDKSAGWGSKGRYLTAFVAVSVVAAALTNEVFSRGVNVKELCDEMIFGITASRNASAKQIVDTASIKAFTEAFGDEIGDDLKAEIDARRIDEVNGRNRWLEALLRFVMPNAIIVRGTKIIEPFSDPRYRIDEQNGVMYIPVSSMKDITERAKLSGAYFSEVPVRRVGLFEGVKGAATVMLSCFEIDIRSVQHTLRLIKEATNGDEANTATS